jgi:hypothetical protein
MSSRSKPTLGGVVSRIATDALVEAASIAQRGLEELRNENDLLRSQLADCEVQLAACHSHSTFLERMVAELTAERDRYKAFTIELSTQFRNMQGLFTDCFARASRLALAKPQEQADQPTSPNLIEDSPGTYTAPDPADPPAFLKPYKDNPNGA